ncbi:VP1054 virion protein [Spodoptera littoralis nucleopolyhedrovirus]|uniref:VP1054 virion protein n=1 Tax=Spodoptera littoralis nuclear polyhedrosis virus TaxID=10456 RepID=M1JTF1_NPVSL|nr:VP1054 virion protein [Spodoptera littoralis nucleopolyhedrovirus]AGE89900.1 VP1054 virion protein [Spodoptera littoralis nucleopolyhedrovirus]
MSSTTTTRAGTTTTTKYNQCVSEKSVSFKPITFRKNQCPIHPLRANCRAIKTFDEDNGKEIIYHFTFIEGYFKQYDGTPYYMRLLPPERDVHDYGKLDVAELMACYVRLDGVGEKFFTIDEAGERDTAVLRRTVKSLIEYMHYSIRGYVLMFDEPQIDVIYSQFRTVLLPQRMYMLSGSEDPTVPEPSEFDIFTVPDTDASVESQNIYKTFLVYNTTLTMMLNQRNPFNAHDKNISIVFRNLGVCPNNSMRVKCCDLKYGGNASPGHFMCPTREIVRRVFKYGKWVKNPNNYRRYFELILRPVQRERRFDDGRTRRTAASANLDAIILDWYNFMEDFKTYHVGQQ